MSYTNRKGYRVLDAASKAVAEVPADETDNNAIQVGDDVEAINATLAQIQSDLDTVEADVTTLQGQVSTLQTDVTNLQTDVGNFQTTVGQLQTDVSNLQTAVGTLQTDVTNLQTAVGTLQTDVTKLKEEHISYVIDGGGVAIVAGDRAPFEIGFNGTITAVRLIADQSGSIVLDLAKDTFANYPPTFPTDSIVASAKPTLSSVIKSEDLTLAGWTTAVIKGDILAVKVDSATTVQRVTLILVIQRT